MLTACKHLLFDAPWIGTYDRVYLKEFGMEQVNTQLAVKILFDDYSIFYEMKSWRISGPGVWSISQHMVQPSTSASILLLNLQILLF